ncbi:site-2 protease family protein [Isoptericola sp. NEAU-Y5]|uniref:Site-2 protease family protein n=1 Tax=Isoptericola luteus TaxID=2879484 RepID=A0ABS7ZFI0_9MICO|nr:site-2 protease family protein [Isoptericola sp. NEAU-Y5]MCA5893232.1 site-2 protease family protein [Isoptericola sp. NEAU-Y5]
MDVLSWVVGIAVVLVGIVVSIGLHELGHMVPAKKFGVRVSEYMVGFGPTLFSRRKGETEYGLKAVPLGGYVRLVGMMPPAPDGTPPARGFFGQVIADARDASTSEIRPGEEHRAFYRLSTPKKLVVMLGGPVMNLVIAVVLMFVVLVGIGLPAITTTVGEVSACTPTSTTASGEPVCAADAAPSPAAAAGLEPGDEVVRWDGTAVTSWDQLSGLIADTPGEQVPVVVLRDGQETALTVTTAEREAAVADAQGNPEVGADGEPVVRTVGFLGMVPTQEYEPLPATSVPTQTWAMVSGTAAIIVTLPVKVADTMTQAFTAEERSADGVLSIVGVGRLAVDAVAADAPVVATLQFLLTLLASLNVALFVFNLIPLLPLDGGHVVNALYEGARRTVARVAGRPRPGPADVAKMMPVAYVMFVVLLGTGVLLMLADVIDPVQLM